MKKSDENTECIKHVKVKSLFLQLVCSFRGYYKLYDNTKFDTIDWYILEIQKFSFCLVLSISLFAETLRCSMDPKGLNKNLM